MLAANGNKLTLSAAVPEPGFIMEETRASYFDETPYVRDPIIAVGQLSEPSGGISYASDPFAAKIFHCTHYKHAKMPTTL